MADDDGLYISQLNDANETSKKKLVALARLAERALKDPDAILQIFHGVDEAFERMLVDKEEANRKFGTAIGRFHETTLLILIRATQY